MTKKVNETVEEIQTEVEETSTAPAEQYVARPTIKRKKERKARFSYKMC